MSEHKTMAITIHGEQVEIDEQMLALILWMNGIPGVRTRFCCQGDPESLRGIKDPMFEPYVAWTATSFESIHYIIAAFQKYRPHGDVVIHTMVSSCEMDCIHLATEWCDNNDLIMFMAWFIEKLESAEAQARKE